LHQNCWMSLISAQKNSDFFVWFCPLIELSLGLINWELHHEDIWGSGGIAPLLTSALDGCEWPVSHLCSFTPRKTAPGTYFIGGWVGPQASLDVMEKRKFFLPLLGIKPFLFSHPAHTLVTILTDPTCLQEIKWFSVLISVWQKLIVSIFCIVTLVI
jgi:hypothetical protein